MRRSWFILALVAAGYIASGCYIVKGNEQALVRRFGRAQVRPVSSGLHFDLPWPFARISRVNLNEVRTISIRGASFGETMGNNYLQPGSTDRQSEFLTGDKNLLHLSVNVQYRVSDPRQFAFGCEAPERQLRCLVEALVTEAVGGSGVDYVHPLGLNELRNILTARARKLPEEHGLGLVVEDVAINDVRPPLLVKQAFLDVSNARAERERMLSEAQSQAERLLAQSQAEARRELDRAETERHKSVSEARGAADRYAALIDQMQRDARERGQPYAQIRQTALRREYLAALEEILPKLAGKVFVDGGDRPIDVTIEQQ